MKKTKLVNMANAIKKQRKALKLTQKELGQFAGCGVAFVYLLESGKPTIRIDKLLDVIKVLGLQIRLETGKEGIVVDEKLSKS